MPRPRISRRGESFQHAVQAQIPKTCLLIVLKDCIFTGAERRPTTCVAECAKKPHYASKQLGDRLHLPHGRGARRVAVVERPCPRDGGESRGWLREEIPTTEDEETEIVTVLTHTHYRVKYLQEIKRSLDFLEIRCASERSTTNCLRELKAISPHQTLAPKKFFFGVETSQLSRSLWALMSGRTT